MKDGGDASSSDCVTQRGARTINRQGGKWVLREAGEMRGMHGWLRGQE